MNGVFERGGKIKSIFLIVSERPLWTQEMVSVIAEVADEQPLFKEHCLFVLRPHKDPSDYDFNYNKWIKRNIGKRLKINVKKGGDIFSQIRECRAIISVDSSAIMEAAFASKISFACQYIKREIPCLGSYANDPIKLPQSIPAIRANSREEFKEFLLNFHWW